MPLLTKMRTIFFISTLLAVFGTGCGGCADDDKSTTAAPGPKPQQQSVSLKHRALGHALLRDAGADDAAQ